MQIYPAILSGGSGERLWPLSRTNFPKQLLALNGGQTLLQQTALRVAAHNGFESPLIIANNEHRFLIAEQIRSAGIEKATLVLEPCGRNTAPAAVVASLLVERENPDAVIALMPSDHAILGEDTFRAKLEIAAKSARTGKIAAFGIQPTRPESGYGYIKAAGGRNSDEARSIAEFTEKPDLATAETFLKSGSYYWNSGIFVFTPSTLLTEMKRYEPEIYGACRDAVEGAYQDLDFLRLAEEPFAQSPSKSLDYAVMEKTDRGVVIPVEMAWSDLGDWNALWRHAAQDQAGNVIQGQAFVKDVSNSYVRSEGKRLLCAYGVDNMVVVATPDAVLVMPRERAPNLKDLLADLGDQDRKELSEHPRVYRPWGHYQDIDAEERFRVKRIVVAPGARLSKQTHKHRSEHWVVVQGRALITRGEEETTLQENQSTYIPRGVVHRLENASEQPLHIIEVQVGDYVGEDDIVRFEDAYGRTDLKKTRL